MPSSAKIPRSLACARCFRLKRRCDHAKPTCGECKRRGTECLPVKSSKDGENITVSLNYLKSLEARIAELEGPRDNASRTSLQVRDIGVQTDQDNVATADPPHNHTSTTNDIDISGVDTAIMKMATHENHPTLESCSFFPFGSTHTPAPGADTILADNEQSEPLTHLNGQPLLLEEVYTNLYFTITHWVWPFLDSSAWRMWYHEWTTEKETEQWKGFFILMVHAIGALLHNGLHPDQGYATRAADLYTSAMTYYPYVMGHSSAILQIKASILMILYSLHCPSSEEIAVTVSSIVPFCAATMSELRKQSSDVGDGTDYRDETGEAIGETLTEPLFITCYMLNEIIVSGWDRPVSAAYRAIDDDMYTLSNEMPCSSSTNSALRHLFSLRKIQAQIRRQRDRSPQGQDAGDSLLKSALDTWKTDIPRYGIEDSPSTYLHPLWMTSLYGYSVIILMQEKRHRLQHEDFEDVLSACVEVCINFKCLLEEGQVMCYTWSALVFQFMAGIMLLYAFWVDYREDIPKRQAFDALCTCASTLSHFAQRWDDATSYIKVFNFILREATWVPEDLRGQLNSDCTREEFEYCLKQLKKQYLHKGVLSMIEDMT
ncbi:hypothetical protein P170DRAFT_497581 [Aspergillus steynii IBT 23096]|uniref:Zn(2)-C6 fungal-type domain-containing protein n=1 Tax=Aspergillus steynii IBT 23096 TaxID=1392250 RepID=A0A2I2G5X0_9EURO|nr:uncharacterized protein P170DRAFT_497581 [Aspergillus steynii IBT 23096]PLB48286.1 hypothetical protein P170DRAFT_497581 [Aspergillus steynii IBT 23096]